MSDCIEDGGFWLPAQFFDDSDSEFCFPTEFPYDLDIGKGKSPGGEWSLMSTSPQSPLVDGGVWPARSAAGSSNGSPNGVASPPLKDGNDAVGELINQAAGQVAKLKLDGGVGPGPTKVNDLMGPPSEPSRPNPMQLYPNASTILNMGNGTEQKTGTGVWYTDPQRAVVGASYGPRPFYSNLNPTRILVSESRAVPAVGGGAAAASNKCRSGTGFFLPRRYGNINNGNKDNKVYSTDSRKKTATGNSSGYYNSNPGRNTNKNNNLNNGTGYYGLSHQPSTGFVSDYDLLIARRNAVMREYGEYYIPKGWGQAWEEDYYI